MFVTTANSLDMPQPLIDRMEIIRLEGYTEDEKVEIAKRHLIPKQMEAHGLKDGELEYQRRRRCARSFAITPAKPAFERSSASWPRSPASRSARILESKIDNVALTDENIERIPRRAQDSATASARKRTRSAP